MFRIHINDDLKCLLDIVYGSEEYVMRKNWLDLESLYSSSATVINKHLDINTM